VLFALYGGALHYTPVLSPLYAVVPVLWRGAFAIYTRAGGAFAIIRSGSIIIRGAFNIIRDAFIQHYFHILSMTCI
jgi:hypothetical protein